MSKVHARKKVKHVLLCFFLFCTFWTCMCSRKNQTHPHNQQRFHKAEQMGIRAENTKHVSRAENPPWKVFCVIFKVVRIYSCQCLLLFIRLQKHWRLAEEKVHRLHFCETNLDKLPSSSSWLIHFWALQSRWGASGRSDERSTDRQPFLQESKKQRKKRPSPKRPIRSLYRRPRVMILGKVGWMTGGGEYKEG